MLSRSRISKIWISQRIPLLNIRWFAENVSNKLTNTKPKRIPETKDLSSSVVSVFLRNLPRDFSKKDVVQLTNLKASDVEMEIGIQALLDSRVESDMLLNYVKSTVPGLTVSHKERSVSIVHLNDISTEVNVDKIKQLLPTDLHPAYCRFDGTTRAEVHFSDPSSALAAAKLFRNSKFDDMTPNVRIARENEIQDGRENANQISKNLIVVYLTDIPESLTTNDITTRLSSSGKSITYDKVVIKKKMLPEAKLTVASFDEAERLSMFLNTLKYDNNRLMCRPWHGRLPCVKIYQISRKLKIKDIEDHLTALDLPKPQKLMFNKRKVRNKFKDTDSLTVFLSSHDECQMYVNALHKSTIGQGSTKPIAAKIELVGLPCVTIRHIHVTADFDYILPILTEFKPLEIRVMRSIYKAGQDFQLLFDTEEKCHACVAKLFETHPFEKKTLIKLARDKLQKSIEDGMRQRGEPPLEIAKVKDRIQKNPVALSQLVVGKRYMTGDRIVFNDVSIVKDTVPLNPMLFKSDIEELGDPVAVWTPRHQELADHVEYVKKLTKEHIIGDEEETQLWNKAYMDDSLDTSLPPVKLLALKATIPQVRITNLPPNVDKSEFTKFLRKHNVNDAVINSLGIHHFGRARLMYKYRGEAQAAVKSIIDSTRGKMFATVGANVNHPVVVIDGIPDTISAGAFAKPIEQFIDFVDVSRNAMIHFPTQDLAKNAVKTLNGMVPSEGGNRHGIIASIVDEDLTAVPLPGYDDFGHIESADRLMAGADFNNEIIGDVRSRYIVVRNMFDRAYNELTNYSDMEDYLGSNQLDITDPATYQLVSPDVKSMYFTTLNAYHLQCNSIESLTIELMKRGKMPHTDIIDVSEDNLIPITALDKEILFRIYLKRKDIAHATADFYDEILSRGEGLEMSKVIHAVEERPHWSHQFEIDDLATHKYIRRPKDWKKVHHEIRAKYQIPYGERIPFGLMSQEYYLPTMLGDQPSDYAIDEYIDYKERFQQAKASGKFIGAGASLYDVLPSSSKEMDKAVTSQLKHGEKTSLSDDALEFLSVNLERYQDVVDVGSKFETEDVMRYIVGGESGMPQDASTAKLLSREIEDAMAATPFAKYLRDQIVAYKAKKIFLGTNEKIDSGKFEKIADNESYVKSAGVVDKKSIADMKLEDIDPQIMMYDEDGQQLFDEITLRKETLQVMMARDTDILKNIGKRDYKFKKNHEIAEKMACKNILMRLNLDNSMGSSDLSDQDIMKGIQSNQSLKEKIEYDIVNPVNSLAIAKLTREAMNRCITRLEKLVYDVDKVDESGAVQRKLRPLKNKSSEFVTMQRQARNLLMQLKKDIRNLSKTKELEPKDREREIYSIDEWYDNVDNDTIPGKKEEDDFDTPKTVNELAKRALQTGDMTLKGFDSLYDELSGRTSHEEQDDEDDTELKKFRKSIKRIGKAMDNVTEADLKKFASQEQLEEDEDDDEDDDDDEADNSDDDDEADNSDDDEEADNSDVEDDEDGASTKGRRKQLRLISGKSDENDVEFDSEDDESGSSEDEDDDEESDSEEELEADDEEKEEVDNEVSKQKLVHDAIRERLEEGGSYVGGKLDSERMMKNVIRRQKAKQQEVIDEETNEETEDTTKSSKDKRNASDLFDFEGEGFNASMTHREVMEMMTEDLEGKKPKRKSLDDIDEENFAEDFDEDDFADDSDDEDDDDDDEHEGAGEDGDFRGSVDDDEADEGEHNAIDDDDDDDMPDYEVSESNASMESQDARARLKEALEKVNSKDDDDDKLAEEANPLTTIDVAGQQWYSLLIDNDMVQKVGPEGRRMKHRVLIVIGNLKGSAGYGIGRGDDPPSAIIRAIKKARHSLVHMDAYQGVALTASLKAKKTGCTCLIGAMPPERGLTGSYLARRLLHIFGVTSASVKFIGTRTPYNQTQAFFKAIGKHQSLEKVARTRGKKFLDLYHMKKWGAGRHDYNEVVYKREVDPRMRSRPGIDMKLKP